MDTSPIVNRVAASSLLTLDLASHRPTAPMAAIDLKDLLFQGQILREKDLRDFVKAHDWTAYQGKVVSIWCSVDAVIPTWAYMLTAIALQPYALRICSGMPESARESLWLEALRKMDWEPFRNSKVVVKGCSDDDIPVSIYAEAATQLRQVAASIMYGEPCSTVPLYKRPS